MQSQGHSFSGRYKALLVEGSGNGYLKTACDYVHLNPARAGLLKAEQGLETYVWSSYRLYVAEGAKPPWLRVDRLLGEWGLRWDLPGAGREFAALMEARRQGELAKEFKPLRRGWCLGSQPFRADMLKYVEAQKGQWHYGGELRESAEAKAERLIAQALRRGGVAEDQLAGWRRGHPWKLELARELRTQTTVTVGWLAQRLHMGSRGHLAHLLCKTKCDQPAPGQATLGI
jgi:REP-associated tyrosine transposase